MTKLLKSASKANKKRAVKKIDRAYGIRSFLKELAYARWKHPKFASVLFDDIDGATIERELGYYRKLNSIMPQRAKDILFEELYEALDAYSKKEYAHAYQELAQCGAVILRTMMMISNEAHDLHGSKGFLLKFRDSGYVNGDCPKGRVSP